MLNIAIATAFMIREPDNFSLDRLLGIRLPSWIGPLGLAVILLTVRYTGVGTEEAPSQEEEARDES